MIPANQIPNILTVIRIILVVPFAVYIFIGEYVTALVLFFVAGLSDGVDGFLARQFNWRSRFGAIADPLADKLLLVTAYIMLVLTSHLPVWLLLIILGRDILIVCGALYYHYFISHYDIQPSLLGKSCTFTQIVFVLALIMSLAELPMPMWAIDYGLYLVTFLTLSSGVHYTLVWTRKGMQERQIKAAHVKAEEK